jgi:hypothetical protein
MRDVFAYEVKPAAIGFEASVPYRQVVYWGETEREATGAMLKGVAELAWNGSLDPAQPERKGCPPLQHTMSILCSQLRWHLECRRDRIDDSHDQISGEALDAQLAGDLARTNEIISGLSTAIAALSRIKAL